MHKPPISCVQPFADLSSHHKCDTSDAPSRWWMWQVPLCENKGDKFAVNLIELLTLMGDKRSFMTREMHGFLYGLQLTTVVCVPLNTFAGRWHSAHDSSFRKDLRDYFSQPFTVLILTGKSWKKTEFRYNRNIERLLKQSIIILLRRVKEIDRWT